MKLGELNIHLQKFIKLQLPQVILISIVGSKKNRKILMRKWSKSLSGISSGDMFERVYNIYSATALEDLTLKKQSDKTLKSFTRNRLRVFQPDRLRNLGL